MQKIELVPDLTHCIETKAKKEYDAAVQKVLAGAPESESNELEEKLETLRLFLETADFKTLRAESEKHLTAGKKVSFLVYLDNGAPGYDMKVT